MGYFTAAKLFLAGNMWIVYLAMAIAIYGAGFGTGWEVNGWRLGHELDECRLQQSNAKLKSAEDTVTDLVLSAQLVHKAADEYMTTRDNTTAQISALRKELKNYATQTPLPVDCTPDVGRVSRLHSAIDKANEAIATGQQSGSAVPESGPAQ